MPEDDRALLSMLNVDSQSKGETSLIDQFLHRCQFFLGGGGGGVL